MFSVILYMLRQIVGHRASPCSFHLFSSLTCDVSQAVGYFASTNLQLRMVSAGNEMLLLCVDSMFVQHPDYLLTIVL
jgi:hypothetical protein